MKSKEIMFFMPLMIIGLILLYWFIELIIQLYTIDTEFGVTMGLMFTCVFWCFFNLVRLIAEKPVLKPKPPQPPTELILKQQSEDYKKFKKGEKNEQ